MSIKTILVIDDESIILDSIARELNHVSSGYLVATASCSDEAVSMLQTDFFNMIITDLNMPGADGFEVLRESKRINPLTMVIILTGYANMDAAINALRLGADDFLQKPCDTDELLIRMTNCFAKQDLMIKVNVYENILPICSYCRRIRDDRQGDAEHKKWYSLEEYMARVQGVNISHGCCPECFAQLTGSSS